MPRGFLTSTGLFSGGLDLDGPITLDGTPFTNPADANFLFAAGSIVMPFTLRLVGTGLSGIAMRVRSVRRVR